MKQQFFKYLQQELIDLIGEKGTETEQAFKKAKTFQDLIDVAYWIYEPSDVLDILINMDKLK